MDPLKISLQELKKYIFFNIDTSNHSLNNSVLQIYQCVVSETSALRLTLRRISKFIIRILDKLEDMLLRSTSIGTERIQIKSRFENDNVFFLFPMEIYRWKPFRIFSKIRNREKNIDTHLHVFLLFSYKIHIIRFPFEVWNTRFG